MCRVKRPMRFVSDEICPTVVDHEMYMKDISMSRKTMVGCF